MSLTTQIPPLTIDDLDTITITDGGNSVLSYGGAGASTTYNWTGAGVNNTWNTSTNGAIGSTQSGNVTISSSSNTGSHGQVIYGAGGIGGLGGGSWSTGTTSVPGNFSIGGSIATISIEVDKGKPILRTQKNEINIDELADMLKLMKQLLAAVASDEEFANRNPALAEAAYDMMMNKLKD
jgi:hypothetical protein